MIEEHRFKSLNFYNIKKKEIISLMLIWQEWTNNNKYNKYNKTNMRNLNMKTTTQKIFTMEILITMERLIG